MALQSRGVKKKKKPYLNCVEVSGINKRLQDRDTWHSCRGKTVQNLILGAEKAKIFKSFFSHLISLMILCMQFLCCVMFEIKVNLDNGLKWIAK